MKKTMLSKIITLSITLILLVGAVFAISVSADDTAGAPSLRVARFNVDHGAQLTLKVAVDAQNTEGVSLQIYSADGSTLINTLTESVPTNIGGKTYLVFSTPALAPKDMYTEFYYKAVSNDVSNCEMKKYSVLEYFYEKIYFDTNTTPTEKTFLEYAKGYAEYAYRIFNKTEPQEYVYAYYDMGDKDTSLSEYLVALGTAITPSSDSGIEAWDVINELGETVASVAAGDSFTATEAGAYKFVPQAADKTIWDFEEGLENNFGTSDQSNITSMVLDADGDGDKEAYIFSKNKSSNAWFAPGIVTETTGSKYTFEMDIRIDAITGNLSFYDFKAGNGAGSSGTEYAFILTIASDGTVTLQSMTQKTVVEGKTLTADQTWHNIKIVGDVAKGGTATLIVDGETWATVTTDKDIRGNSFEIFIPKSTSTVNTKFYLDNCGFNYHD